MEGAPVSSLVAAGLEIAGEALSRAGSEPSARAFVLVGVGWATVELDRAGEELGPIVDRAADERAWRTAERDGLLGAAARVSVLRNAGELRGSHEAEARLADFVSLVLLEPDTEGRLAATLARFGEGPAVAYVTLERDAARGLLLSRAEPGPLGLARLVVGTPPWGPHVVVVGSTQPASATIASVIESAPIAVRAAAAEDADRIAAMFTDEGYPAGPSDVLARLARFDDESSSVLVADLDGAAIGFIALHAIPRFEHDDVVVRIVALVVDADARERGVGRLLMAEAEAFARERGAAFVEVTAGHHRPEARRLYEAVGYDASATTYLRKRL